jgi:hypothetical protein
MLLSMQAAAVCRSSRLLFVHSSVELVLHTWWLTTGTLC